VKKVATSIVVSDELLDDAPAVTTFVNGQLSLFVQIEVEPVVRQRHARVGPARPLQRRGASTWCGGAVRDAPAVRAAEPLQVRALEH
jgi:hypothetical protein